MKDRSINSQRRGGGIAIFLSDLLEAPIAEAALKWLPDDDPRRPLSLQKRAMGKAQQSRHSMLQASAKSPAPSTSIEVSPSIDVLPLHQHLRKSETALAVQLQMGKNGFKVFLYQARVPSVPSLLCNCGRGHQTANPIIIHCCILSAAWLALRDNQGRLPDHKQLLTTPRAPQKATKWVIERGILAQC
jgi:hypothetical protein